MQQRRGAVRNRHSVTPTHRDRIRDRDRVRLAGERFVESQPDDCVGVRFVRDMAFTASEGLQLGGEHGGVCVEGRTVGRDLERGR